MINPIPKCAGCGVPARECLKEGKSINYYRSSINKNWNDDTFTSDWYCSYCMKDKSINCSHCDKPIEGILPDLLDDGSFLCKECDNKLNEELEEIK